MGIKPTTTKEHLRLGNIPSPPVNLRRRSKQGEQEKRKSKRERLLNLI